MTFGFLADRWHSQPLSNFEWILQGKNGFANCWQPYQNFCKADLGLQNFRKVGIGLQNFRKAGIGLRNFHIPWEMLCFSIYFGIHLQLIIKNLIKS